MYSGDSMLFSKMNGIGNDYIFFEEQLANATEYGYLLKNVTKLVPPLSDRNFGIGGDGVVLIGKSNEADASMRIFNADGSEANMCGNALRCVGKILFEHSGGKKQDFCVSTHAGVKFLKVESNEPSEALVSSIIGNPKLVGEIDDVEFYDVGNAHAVFYVQDLGDTAINRAREISLKHGVNAEAVLLTHNGVFVRVWERGSNETLACGTGATCVAKSLFRHGIYNESVEINLKGGKLTAFKLNDDIAILGKATLNYIGEVNIKNYG